MPTRSPRHREKAKQTVPSPLEEATARLLRSGDQPGCAVFLARALNALAHLVPALGERALDRAAGASSDYETLLSALEESAVLETMRREDPLAPARLRGIRARTRLLKAEGRLLAVDEVAKLLGITRQAVQRQRRAGRLLALRTGRRRYVYPSWQFGPDGLLPGLQEVLSDLREHDPWMQVGFFLNSNVSLDGASPLDALRLGHIEAIRHAARTYGEHGAV